MTHKIPEPTVLRLSTYRRCLQQYEEESAFEFISSRQLGTLANRNAAIVRKDLSYFGEYGVPGKGYHVGQLIKHILKIMNLRRPQKALLIGVGNLGKALLGYPGFKRQGFDLVAAFDNDQKKIGRKVSAIKVQSLKDLPGLLKRHKIKIGLITVAAAAAQETANLLVAAGLPAIINFTPSRVWVPKKVVLRNVDLTRELEVASYLLGE